MEKRKRLTNTDVERFAKEQPKDRATLWDGEVRGFGVRWFASSSVLSYILIDRVKGTQRERTITIGRHNDPWRVDQARAKALELKAKMLGGVDPVQEAQAVRRQAEAQKALEMTLREVMQHYLEHKQTKYGPLRQSTKDDIKRHCDKNMAEWLDKPAANITRDMCLAKFTAMTERGPQQANACMIYLRALLTNQYLT